VKGEKKIGDVQLF